MSRELDSSISTAAAAEDVRLAILTLLQFDEGDLRLTSAPFDMAIDADDDGVIETYAGVGDLGKISAVPEGAELQAYSGQLTLSGLDPAMIALALGSHYQGRKAWLWLALLDADHVPVGPPMLLFRGRMDTMHIEIGDTAEITLVVQSRMADWENPRVRRYTNEDQQALFPGDKGLEFVPLMVEKKLNWGGTVID